MVRTQIAGASFRVAVQVEQDGERAQIAAPLGEGLPFFEDRGAVTDEYIRAWWELWTKNEPEFAGAYCSFSDLVFEPKPSRKERAPALADVKGT